MKKIVLTLCILLCFVVTCTVAMAADTKPADGIKEIYAQEQTEDGEVFAIEKNSAEYIKMYGLAPDNYNTHLVQFTVQDGLGNALQGVTLYIDAAHKGVTNENGALSVRLPDGQYSYEFVKKSYESVTGSFAVKGKDISMPVVSMPTLSSLKIVVTDGTVGIGGAAVSVGEQTVNTNALGLAELWVKDGTHEYTIAREGFQSVSGSVQVSGATRISVEITGGHRVEFTVMGEANKPVVGASINIPGYSTIVANSKGKARAWVAEGSYDYTVSHPEYNTASGSLRVEDGLVSINVDLTLKRYVAAFTVKDKNGKAIEDAKITIPGKVLHTNSQGKAQVEGVLPGSYEIAVSKSGYQSYAGEFLVNNKTARVTVVLAENAPEPTPTPTPQPTVAPGPVVTSSPRPPATYKPSSRPTTKPTSKASMQPTSKPTASPLAKKTPVIASPVRTSIPAPTASAVSAQTTKMPEVPTPSPSPDQGLLSVGFNLVDANGEPLADYLTELHSDPQAGKTDSDGYIFYINVEPGEHTFYLKEDNNTIIAQKQFTLDYAGETAHKESETSVDHFGVNNSINAVTLDIIYDKGQLTMANIHEGWSQFYSELPNGSNAGKVGDLNKDLVFWLLLGIAVLVLILVILIVARRNMNGSKRKNDYLQGGLR